MLFIIDNRSGTEIFEVFEAREFGIKWKLHMNKSSKALEDKTCYYLINIQTKIYTSVDFNHILL